MKNAIFYLINSCFLITLYSSDMVPNLTHTENVTSMAISSDERRLITASNDKTLKIWDMASLRLMRTLAGHEEKVKKVVLSKDGRTAISLEQQYWIVWDISAGKMLGRYAIENGGNDIAISPDGKKICLLYSMKAAIFEIASGKLIRELDGYDSINANHRVFSHCNFSPGGNHIALAFRERRRREKIDASLIWDYVNDTISGTLYGPTGMISDIKYDRTGNLLYVAGGPDDASIRVYDINSMKEVRKLGDFSNKIDNLAIARTNDWLAFAVYDQVKIVNPLTGVIIFEYDSKSLPVAGISFVQNEEELLIANEDKSIKKINIRNNRIADALEKDTYNNNIINCFALSESKSKLFCGTGSAMRIWDTKTTAITGNLPALAEHYLDNQLLLSPDENTLYFITPGLNSGKEGLIKAWDISKDKEIYSLEGHKDLLRSISLAPDGKTLYSCGWENSIFVWDLVTGKQKKELKTKAESVHALAVSPDGKFLVTGGGKPALLWRTDKLKLLRELNHPEFEQTMLQGITFCGNNIIAISGMDTGIDLYDGQSGKYIRNIGGKTFFHNYYTSLASTKDGRRLVAGNRDNKIRIWKTDGGSEPEKIISAHSSDIVKVVLSSDEKRLYSASSDGLIKMFNFPDCEELATFTSRDSDWLAYTPDGYYDCSPNGGRIVSIVDGENIYAIDQFAVSKNRPDVILTRLGSKDSQLIEHFKKQYLKRLRKIGLTENHLSTDLHHPSAIIEQCIQNGASLNLDLTFSDTKYPLKSYNIFVNDVPLFGSSGKPLTNKTASLKEQIQLNYDRNKIELSCTNDRGVESPRAYYVAFNDQKTSPNLYLLAFGVSQYDDPDLNLQYAGKDAHDLEQVISTYKGKGFNNIYTEVLTNQQVTPEAIKGAKGFVKNAGVDDTFILFIAGHGMHDSDPEATYYFLTSNTDLTNLKGTAADFETIEDLLQGIPPRNKLFLMDACESGELDEEEQNNYLDTATGQDIASRGFKKIPEKKSAVSQPSSNRPYLFQKDRFIYNDLVRRSGAIVFSSSRGGELSYERSDIENGLFTEYILKALTTNEADRDGDGFLSTDELRIYVSSEVAKASGELQHPTVDRDNIYQKFGFKIK